MNGLLLRRTPVTFDQKDNPFHNKTLFSLQKLLSNQDYTSNRIHETGTNKLRHFAAVVMLLVILSITGTVSAEEYHSGAEETEAEQEQLKVGAAEAEVTKTTEPTKVTGQTDPFLDSYYKRRIF